MRIAHLFAIMMLIFLCHTNMHPAKTSRIKKRPTSSHFDRLPKTIPVQKSKKKLLKVHQAIAKSSLAIKPSLDTTPDKCSICWENLNDKTSITHLPCHITHRFHTSCINPWLKKCNSCPICRKPMGNHIHKTLAATATYMKEFLPSIFVGSIICGMFWIDDLVKNHLLESILPTCPSGL